MKPVKPESSVIYLGSALGRGPALTPGEVIALKQEDARQWLAALLIALVFAIVLIALIFFAAVGDRSHLLEVVKLTFGSVIALIGTVVGFYFGTKKDIPS
jgi:hypothetical protein